jgi:hypothetical protein
MPEAPESKPVGVTPPGQLPEGPNVYESVAKAAKLVKVASKDKTNEFHKYDYRSIEAVMDAVHDAVASAGITVVLHTMRNFQRLLVDVKNGKEVLVCYEGVFRVFGPAGDWFETVHFCEGMDSRDKASNKASTAGYKEVLQKLFTLPFGHDQAEADDGPSVSEPRQRRERRQEDDPGVAGGPSTEQKPAPGIEYRAAYPSEGHVIWQVSPTLEFKIVKDMTDAELTEATNRIGRRIAHFEQKKQAAAVKDARQDQSRVEAEKKARLSPSPATSGPNTAPADTKVDQKPAPASIDPTASGKPAGSEHGYASYFHKLVTGKLYHGWKKHDPTKAEVWFTVKGVDEDVLIPAGQARKLKSAMLAGEDPPGAQPIEVVVTASDFDDRFHISGEVVDRAEALTKLRKPANAELPKSSQVPGAVGTPGPATSTPESAADHVEAKSDADEVPAEAASLALAVQYNVAGTKALVDVDLHALKTMTAGEVAAMAMDAANAALFAEPFDPKGTEPLTAEWFVKAWIPFHEEAKGTKRDARKLSLIAINHYKLGTRYDKLRPELVGPETIAKEKQTVAAVKEMFGGKSARKPKSSPMTS